MQATPPSRAQWPRHAANVVLKLAYPAVILGAWHIGAPRYVGIVLLALLWVQRWIGTGSTAARLRVLTRLDWVLAGLLTCSSAAIAITDSETLLRLYPVMVNAALLLTFGATLRHGPSMVEKFARLRTPELPPRAVLYTRRVTQVWCGFFAANALIAALVALYGSRQAWALYNGAIAYALVGLLIVGEIAYRKLVVRPYAGGAEAA
ncbi:COG4648 family protein [Ralstonia pseudosolanacearum]